MRVVVLCLSLRPCFAPLLLIIPPSSSRGAPPLALSLGSTSHASPLCLSTALIEGRAAAALVCGIVQAAPPSTQKVDDGGADWDEGASTLQGQELGTAPHDPYTRLMP